MNTQATLALLIALCRYLEVPPEEIVGFFKDGNANQEYFELLVRLERD